MALVASDRRNGWLATTAPASVIEDRGEITVNRHVGLLRYLVRFLFGRRIVSVRGEAGGVRLYFSPSEYPSLMLGVSRFEREIRDRWENLLTPGEIIFDVGANIGITVHRFQALLAGACVVHAFEPVNRNLELLRRNCAAFGDRVRVVQAAVGDRNGRIAFDDNIDHGGLSRINNIRKSWKSDPLYWQHYESIEVNVLTLDQYCADQPDAVPSFIKLDIEGAGGLALEGAQGILSRNKPILSVSFHGDEERSKVLEIVEAHGYRGIQLDSTGSVSWCEPEKSDGDFAHPGCERTARLVARAAISPSLRVTR
jgi:FkbM family methyltransferase